MTAIRDLLGVLCVLMLWSRPVLAGPVEQMVDVAFGVGTGALSIVARYEQAGGGLLFGNMDSSSWRLQCGSAFLEPGESLRGPLVTLANGPVLVPTSKGVVSGNLEGCDYRHETVLADSVVIDLQAHPNDPHTALAVVNVNKNGSGSTSLFRRSSSGVWSMLGSTLQTAVSSGMRAAYRAGKVRIYQSLMEPVLDQDGGVSATTFKLRYTEDDAKSFKEYELETEGPARVVAIDPMNPERVVLAVDKERGGQRIVVSPDAGATLRTYLEVERLGGITFAPDGRVWIGSKSDSNDPATQGIWTAANLDTAPTRLELSNYTVQCLGYYPPSDRLYGCQHFWLGEVDKNTGEFNTKVSFSTVEDFVRCEGAAERCKAQLCKDYCGPAHFAAAPVCSAYDEPECGKPVAAREGASLAGPDAGVPSAGNGGGGTSGSQPTAAGKGGKPAPRAAGGAAGPESEPAASSGCACHTVGGDAGAAWLLFAAWPLLRLRRRCLLKETYVQMTRRAGR